MQAQPDPARAQRGRLGIGRRLYRSTGECHRPLGASARPYGMLTPSCSAATCAAIPCRPSVLDVEAVADTAAPVVALLTACTPRDQGTDQ